MPDELITFVFTVVCTETAPTKCKFPGDGQLDNFKNNMDKIRAKLSQPERDMDPHLLRLEMLDVYAGLPLDHQPPGELTEGERYGRVIFTGRATGKDIFTQSIEELQNDVEIAADRNAAITKTHADMKLWQVKFNYLLHEIFSCDKDKDGNSLTDRDGNPIKPYVEEYARLGRNPNDYHPRKFVENPDDPLFDHTSDIEHPWYAAWTIFVTSSPNHQLPYVMGGQGAC